MRIDNWEGISAILDEETTVGGLPQFRADRIGIDCSCCIGVNFIYFAVLV